MFNALKYTEELEKAGFTKTEAETTIKVLIEVMNENFALKSDLKEMETALRSDMKASEQSIRADMKEMERSIRADIREMEYKLTIKLGSFIAIAIGTTATLVKMLQ